MSPASRLVRSARCPLLHPPVLPSQDVLCCTSNGIPGAVGGAPTLCSKDNGPLSGVTQPLFVGVEHPSEPSPLASQCLGCCRQESGSTCSLGGWGAGECQVRRVMPASCSYLCSSCLRLYCWSLTPSYKESLQTSAQASAEPGTGHTMKGLTGPGPAAASGHAFWKRCVHFPAWVSPAFKMKPNTALYNGATE